MLRLNEKIAEMAINICKITEKTHWIFITLTTKSGVTGYGEATLTGRENDVLALFPDFAQKMLDSPDVNPRITFPVLDNLPLAALVSGYSQALWDIKAKMASKPLANVLSDSARKDIEVYANINRRTWDRSASGFAESAVHAVAHGFSAIKIAPFDEVNCHVSGHDNPVASLKKGIERIKSVRSAIGEKARLMIDCHWRLDVSTSLALLDSLSEYHIYWLECPVPETVDNIEQIKKIKAAANENNILLAGCEENIRLDGFRPFIHQNACDIYMPDAKYVGGLEEMMAVATAISGNKGTFSPHNPSGPVCDAVSLHLCASVSMSGMLEMQYDETPLFHEITGDGPKKITGGKVSLPQKNGHGVSLEPSVIEKLTVMTARFRG